MSGFSESTLLRKLTELNPSQQSIQTLSLWLIHHRKYYHEIVRTWKREFLKSNIPFRLLTLTYLANDVIQNSKRKGPEFCKHFEACLSGCFDHLSKVNCDAKTKGGIIRVLDVWAQREIYDKKRIDSWKRIIEKGRERERDYGESSRKERPPSKKIKVEVEKKKEERVSFSMREKRHSETVIEVDGKTEAHIILSPNQKRPGDPPEPEELVKALLDMEKSASADAATREKLSSLPPEVSSVNLLSKLQDREAAEKLHLSVTEAVNMLQTYNGRLETEMEERHKLTGMLADFLHTQKELLLQAEERHLEFLEKLQKVYQVREELKCHLQNLPDLSKMADVSGGLAPLPSAGDLFRIKNKKKN